MSGCVCGKPTMYRATSESGDYDFLYLRCCGCGGKAGRVSCDVDELTDTITNPNSISQSDSGRPATVSVQFEKHDSPFPPADTDEGGGEE